MENYNFESQLLKGLEVEEFFKNYFTNLGYKVRISDDQAKGDLIVNKNYLEIKSDNYNNKNYLFELIHIYENGMNKLGWFLMLNYKNLIYFKTKNPEFYLSVNLKELFKFYYDNIQVLSSRNRITANSNYRTINFYLTEEELLNKKLAIKKLIKMDVSK